MKSSFGTGLIFGLTLIIPLSGCTPKENPYVNNNVPAATVSEFTETQNTESTTQAITVTACDSEAVPAPATTVQTVPAETTNEQLAEPQEPIFPDNSFKIRTDSTDYVDIAKEVLTSVYSKSEQNSEFEIIDIRYMAKGMVEERLWFAVKFTVQTDTESSRLEALIQRDKEQEYSLITINTKVPIDNLVDEENAPPPADTYLAEVLTPFQGTNVLTSDWSRGDIVLPDIPAFPSPNDLIIFAQKNIGEKATYTFEEIYNEISRYILVPQEHIKSSGSYNQTTDSFPFIENFNICNYAFVSAESDNSSAHRLTIVSSKADEKYFSKEILLTIVGTPEQYQLVSCMVKEREITQHEIPFIISHNEIPHGEKNISVDLILNDGHYIESVNGENIFCHGYRGKYELVVYDEETELFRTEVSFPEREFLNFKEPFKLAFYDCNDDGNLEFSLGQWQNDEMYYQFYSIDEAGNISPIDSEPIITQDAEYSKIFTVTQ